MKNRDNIILNNIIVSGNVVEYDFSVTPKLQKYFKTNRLIIEYNHDISNIPESILSIPFIGSFMAFAWITNSVMWVQEIDASFYNAIPNIKRTYQEIYYYYNLNGRIVPSIVTNNSIKEPSHSAMLLLGGGVDANASFIRNKDHISSLCNIQGWYNNINDVDIAAEAEFDYTTNFSAKFDKTPILVKSNFAKVITNAFDKKYKHKLGDTWWHGFSHSMSFISIAIPIAYKLGVTQIIIASSLTTGLNHLCASNSTTDNEFRYANLGHIFHDGFELHRQNKVKIIVDFQQQINKPYYLKVCSFNNKNCCKCEKCLRTILGIIAENANPRDFGFEIQEDITIHWKKVLAENIALMGFDSEKVIHWPHIKKRMRENYNLMTEEAQNFVDWFISFNFDEAKRKAILKYYYSNFFSILKRKLQI